MITTKRKKSIWIWGLFAVFLIGTSIAVFFLLPPKKPDAQQLLAGADTLTKQNLCLMALLEDQPENAAYQQRLLANFQALGADPLTVYALEQTFGIQAKPASIAQPEQAGTLLKRGGIAKMKDYAGAYSVAEGADTIYYATDDGLYADYHGLNIRIASIRASNLIAAEGGIYFLNDAQRKVQYLARDGHKIQTLSPIDAKSFAFFGDALWIIDTDNALYCDEKPIKTPYAVRSLTATPSALFVACNDEEGAAKGVLAIDAAGLQTMVLSSPALSIFGGADGCLYYINDYNLPMRYDPAEKEATILNEKKAISVTYENETVYYLNEKGKVKKIKVA